MSTSEHEPLAHSTSFDADALLSDLLGSGSGGGEDDLRGENLRFLMDSSGGDPMALLSGMGAAEEAAVGRRKGAQVFDGPLLPAHTLPRRRPFRLVTCEFVS